MRSILSKQKLLLSVAAVALLGGPVFAQHVISSGDTETTPIVTGVLDADDDDDDDYVSGAGSVEIESGGVLKVNTKQTSAIFVNSAAYVYNGGAIKNNGVSTAYGINVDFLDSTNTDSGYDSGVYTGTATTLTEGTDTFDSSQTYIATTIRRSGDGTVYYQVGSCDSACTFTNEDGDVVAVFDLSSSGYSYTDANGDTRVAAIYLDSDSEIDLTGDGTGKYGIVVDATDAEDDLAILIGDIVVEDGAEINIKGNSARGIYITTGAELIGNLTINGSITLNQTTATSTSASSLFGVFVGGGGIDGDVLISDTAEITVTGGSAQGLLFSGSGITGSLTINGSVIARGIDPADATDVDTTYPEASIALSIGGSIDEGVMIGESGVLQVSGTTEVVLISPSLSYGTSYYDDPESLVIGLYDDSDDPGFGFYNRGTMTISPINENNSVAAAIQILGAGELYPTIIEGGFYNSGTISVSAFTDSNDNTVSANGIVLGTYVYLGGTVDDDGNYTSDSASYDVAYDESSSASLLQYSLTGSYLYEYDSSGYSYDDGGAGKDTSIATDQASFVNTGTISVSVYGLAKDVKDSDGGGGGTARALLISANSSVSSIINTGTISASVTVNDESTDDVTTAAAYAIVDYSGSLTYIWNYGGTIAATATTLDDDAEITVAVYSAGNSKTASGSGMTIVNESTSSSSAIILGDIYFGDGDYQQIYVLGNSSYYAYLYGDIYYGGSTYPGAINGDLLYVGAYSVVSGTVTATNGVAVQVMDYGSLTLENEEDTLTASNLYLADEGYLSISVSADMEDTGAIDVLDVATIELTSDGSNLGVSYNSYVPQGYNSFILIRTEAGNLLDGDGNSLLDSTDSDGVLTAYNDAIDEGKPWLFEDISLKVETSDDGAYDELILYVTPKTADQLHLTGYAADADMFEAVNDALSADRTLGAAMVNYITDDASAQNAYDAFAPNVTGGTRAILISVTDQATGVIGERQRLLREHNRDLGRMSLWMQLFVQNMKLPSQGKVSVDEYTSDTDYTTVTRYSKHGFKDKGFGFALGADWGSPRFGWYGAAITFFNGNVEEIGRDSHQNQKWVLADFYTTWRGKGFFFDSKVGAGVGSIHGKRFLTLTYTDDDDEEQTFEREADNTHLSTVLSGGFSGGAVFDYGAWTFTPQVSVDGLVMREEGYTENNPDNSTSSYRGFDLKVKPYYARSLRGYVGTSVSYDFTLFGTHWRPELRGGYRYDLFADPVKVKAAMRDIDPDISGNQTSNYFRLTGPATPQGSLAAATSLGAYGDGWSFNLGLEFVRGSNDYTEQVASFNLLFRM